MSFPFYNIIRSAFPEKFGAEIWYNITALSSQIGVILLLNRRVYPPRKCLFCRAGEGRALSAPHALRSRQ